jgi:integrase/recombinase XerC
LKRNKLVDKNPITEITSLKKPDKIPVFVKEENLNKLFSEEENSYFTSDFQGVRDNLIIDLLYSTGIRISELRTLQVQNVDLENLSIKVVGKRKKERRIPINVKLKNKIQQYILLEKEQFQQKQSKYLLVTNAGKDLYDMFIYRCVQKYLSFITSQNKKNPHILRHSFATHLLNNGAELNNIKELLGHANLAATQVYTHNTFEKLNYIYKHAHPRAKN